MIVVSDTSPLNYLVLIDAAHVLPVLFREVYIPQQVAAELTHSTAPELVRLWIGSPPSWLLVRSPTRIHPSPKLGAGEVHAISLAEELGAEHVLIDEWAARAVARERGLHVIGTLGVLDQAAAQNMIDLKRTLDHLLQTNFRIERKLVDQLLEEDRKRKQKHDESPPSATRE